MSISLKSFTVISSLLWTVHVTGRALPADTIPETDTSNLIIFTLFPDQDPFQSDESIRIGLEFNMKKFIKEKNKGEKHEAILRYTNADGSLVEQEIQISSRGNFRKNHCYFPPVKLNFKNTEIEDEYMNDIKSLKLVTHCKGGETYQQYILKEYLVYRMFNILTDNSYRVRLIEIEYVDSQQKKKPFSRYGFIVESNDHLASRIDAVRIEMEGIPTWLTDTYQVNLMTMFQYMIGNLDWAIANLHNIRLFKEKDLQKPKPLAIPYDFDYCGMVNTYYAVPPEGQNIKSVRERVYRGYCLNSEEEYQVYFNVFLEQRNAIYLLVRNCSLLEKRHRDEMLNYLDEFYQIIENPVLMRRQIINNCRVMPSR
jgi:hypothetical protein